VAEEVGPQYRFLHIGDEEDPLELSVECLGLVSSVCHRILGWACSLRKGWFEIVSGTFSYQQMFLEG
jgi:hypothetical protein